MKKFLSVFCVSLLFVSLLLPFSAHADSVDSAIGLWTFNETIDLLPLEDVGGRFEGDGYRIEFSYTYVRPDMVECDGNAIFYNNMTNKIRFLGVSGVTTTYYDPYFASSGWVDGFDRTINITSEPSESFKEWLIANAKPYEAPKCDGSACAWADDDFDGICDTCGFALMSFRYDLLEYAHSTVQDGMEYFETGYWLITKTYSVPAGDLQYRLYLSEAPIKYDQGQIYSESGLIQTIVTTNSSGVPVTYGWTTGNPNSYTSVASETPVDASADIDGFFPLSLQQMVNMAVVEGLGTMTQQVAGTMKILVVCGVGCLACIIVLSLFGKRSLIFRD